MLQRDSFHTLIGSKEKQKPVNFPELLEDATLCHRYQDSEMGQSQGPQNGLQLGMGVK